tara:strand:+ start:436 stop:639 length:204 start_codon:yes stop_codon:yes gene_type:complete
MISRRRTKDTLFPLSFFLAFSFSLFLFQINTLPFTNPSSDLSSDKVQFFLFFKDGVSYLDILQAQGR